MKEAGGCWESASLTEEAVLVQNQINEEEGPFKHRPKGVKESKTGQ